MTLRGKSTRLSQLGQNLIAEVRQNLQWLKENTTKYFIDLDAIAVRNLKQRMSATGKYANRRRLAGIKPLELNENDNSARDDLNLAPSLNILSSSIPKISTASARKHGNSSQDNISGSICKRARQTAPTYISPSLTPEFSPQSMSDLMTKTPAASAPSVRSYIDASTDTGFMYAPAYSTSDSGLDPSDSRFHKTQSNHDRQQLLWSLYPTIKHFLENLEGETVEIDLNGSYKLCWNKMQEFYGKHMLDHKMVADSELIPMLVRYNAWTGGIDNFDVGTISSALLRYLSAPLIVEARNKTKAEYFRYLATERCKEKACKANEMSTEGSEITTPQGVKVQLINGQLTIIDFRLRPTRVER